MNVTEVTIYPVDPSGKLRAYVSFVLDGRFAVHGAKIIETAPGRLTCCMPNRKASMKCPRCLEAGGDTAVDVTSDFCGRCGAEMPPFHDRTRGYRKEDGKLDVHRDVCHPLDGATRDAISRAVLDKYREVLRGPEDAA